MTGEIFLGSNHRLRIHVIHPDKGFVRLFINGKTYNMPDTGEYTNYVLEDKARFYLRISPGEDCHIASVMSVPENNNKSDFPDHYQLGYFYDWVWLEFKADTFAEIDFEDDL
jgi:hypothetical protein